MTNQNRMFNPPHPGKVLYELQIEPLNMPITEVAEHLNVSRQALSRVLNGKAAISTEMALRLSEAFDTTPELWLNMQLQYDLWQAEQELKGDKARMKQRAMRFGEFKRIRKQRLADCA